MLWLGSVDILYCCMIRPGSLDNEVGMQRTEEPLDELWDLVLPSHATAAIPTPHEILNRRKLPSAAPASHSTAGSRPSGNEYPSPVISSEQMSGY